MAITYVAQTNPSQAMQIATGQFTSDGSAGTASITLGFSPRFIRIVDETTQEDYTWIDVMGAVDVLQRVDAGTAAMDTTQLVTASGRTVTFVTKASKTYDWVAIG